jgi:hypothetical protein
MRLLEARRALPQADARLLLWVLGAFLAGTGCGAASVVLAFTWAATGAGPLMTASQWTARGAYGCLAAVCVLGVLLGRRKRRQAREREGGGL